ncbi:glycerophosphodiester phosphodiesterase family protein [Flavobacterium sp. GT3R68]|uniref:glycerophosphodiester phosphodiesterase n=1 Tax=Flavobacterium sp. GT3R68 TaxID=2594437 RepID=UPI000F86FCE7|nr:glycerophosphodiester phosphodiesterase family protein [Flavobacterium sp. GT3R68]RTY86221.1 glycerophosphodiester phosphodiesterase [Flavobacterium sp. GSN2]TRW94050.1 glycerophosphodiester phosphodiesterase [Flavobacterium sp. GT3R68]
MNKILNIAHRGAKAYAPENTLVAFQKALEMTVDGIELDVHLCKTGHIIVIHDHTVDRTTNGEGSVNDLTLDEIKALRINHEHHIPTLTEVFEHIEQKCLINIELKGAGTAKPVEDLIEYYVNEKNWSYDTFLVSSFDWLMLMDIHLANPKIPLGVLANYDLDLAFAFTKFIQAQSIHSYYHLLSENKTAEMLEQGFQVFAWTVNEPEDIQKIKSFQVTGIISDFPDRI